MERVGLCGIEDQSARNYAPCSYDAVEVSSREFVHILSLGDKLRRAPLKSAGSNLLPSLSGLVGGKAAEPGVAGAATAAGAGEEVIQLSAFSYQLFAISLQLLSTVKLGGALLVRCWGMRRTLALWFFA